MCRSCGTIAAPAIYIYLQCVVYQICFTGIRQEGTWKLIDELEDPELKVLASRLPNTILHSQAASTVKKYLGAFRRWKAWATSHNLVPVPAKPHELALYLQHLGDTKKSKSGLRKLVMLFHGCIQVQVWPHRHHTLL